MYYVENLRLNLEVHYANVIKRFCFLLVKAGIQTGPNYF